MLLLIHFFREKAEVDQGLRTAPLDPGILWMVIGKALRDSQDENIFLSNSFYIEPRDPLYCYRQSSSFSH